MQQSRKLAEEIATLREAYAPTWRGDPAALGAMTSDELVRQVLTDDGSTVEVRAHAVGVAPHVATPEILGALLQLVRNPGLAGLAANSLVEIKSLDPVQGLEQLLLDEGLPVPSRAAAAEALGWLSPIGADHAVMALLRTAPDDPMLAQALIDAAGLLQLRENRRDRAPDIARLLKSPSADVRGAALRVLGNMKAREVMARIASLVADTERTSTGATVGERALAALNLLNAPEQR